MIGELLDMSRRIDELEESNESLRAHLGHLREMAQEFLAIEESEAGLFSFNQYENAKAKLEHALAVSSGPSGNMAKISRQLTCEHKFSDGVCIACEKVKHDPTT